jgi:hypothetical protein
MWLSSSNASGFNFTAPLVHYNGEVRPTFSYFLIQASSIEEVVMSSSELTSMDANATWDAPRYSTTKR